MPDSAPARDLLTIYASSKPTRRYYGAFSVFCFGFTLDFFDFYLGSSQKTEKIVR